MKPLFTEKQRFNQWWLWVLLIISSVAPAIILYKEFTNNSLTSGSLSALIILLLVIVLFVVLKMKTTITQKNIQLVYFPFVWKTINIDDIASLEVINYGFVGGWGIRLGTKYGTVYNTRGNKGLHIKLKNGKQLVIGTQRTEELEKVVEQLNS